MKQIKINLFQKFIIAFVSVGLIPIIILSYFTHTHFVTEAETIIEDNYRQVALYSAKNIDNAIEKYDSLTKLLYSYNDTGNNSFTKSTDGQGLARILKKDVTKDAEKLARRLDIISFTKLVISSDQYIRSAIFVDSQNDIYTSSKNNVVFADKQKFFEITQHEDASKRGGKMNIISPHQNMYFGKSSNWVLTMGRNYYDLASHIDQDFVLGTLYIDIDIRAIEDVFSELEVFHEGEIFITDKNGLCLYSNNPDYLMTSLEKSDNPNSIDIVSGCESIDWDVILRIDYSKEMEQINKLVAILYLIVGACIAGLILLSVVYSKLLSMPIKGLLKSMKKVELGDLNVVADIRSYDEIGELARGFNHMILQLKKYIETSLFAQIRRKEAELNSLKTQIQPHFLYNSLEIIRMNAIANEDETTGEMAYLLSKQMRYLIGEVNETVSLEKELNMIRDYFKLVNIRYEDRMTSDYKIDMKFLNVKILKLSLQPIVENAVIHGLKPKGNGKVMIMVEQRDKDLAIIIMDSGVGMNADRISYIEKHLEDEGLKNVLNEDKVSIGLKNVHDRLRYKYGEPYGITITSQLNIGTSITILQPYL